MFPLVTSPDQADENSSDQADHNSSDQADENSSDENSSDQADHNSSDENSSDQADQNRMANQLPLVHPFHFVDSPTQGQTPPNTVYHHYHETLVTIITITTMKHCLSSLFTTMKYHHYSLP